MPTLHIINKSAFADKSVLTTIQRVADYDSLLFIENGVLSILPAAGIIQHIPAKVRHMALDCDLTARGIPLTSISAHVINYDEFVRETLNHDRVVSW